MNRKLVITGFYLLLFFPSFSQVEVNGRAHIKELSSKAYSGRGYVNNGLIKSAKYIRQELKKANVEPGTQDYFQKTPTFPVNTFPGKISFQEIENNQSHISGKTFLLHPASGTIKLKGKKIIKIKPLENLPAFKSNSAYYIEKEEISLDSLNLIKKVLLESKNIKNSLLIIHDSSKLTWSPSMEKSNNAILTTNKAILSDRISAKWRNEWKANFQGINVIGKVRGERSDSSVYFTAHYDHLGMLGEHVFPGANDNASGTAMLIELASYYAKNKPEFDTYFIFTCAEEIGLLGSYFYIQDPVSTLSKIKILINLDMVGTGDEGITVVNAIKHQDFYNAMKNLGQEKLVEIKARGEACNSDHCLFDRAGVPAVFIYTLGGKQAYHDINDDGSDLSLNAFENLFELLTKVVAAY